MYFYNQMGGNPAFSIIVYEMDWKVLFKLRNPTLNKGNVGLIYQADCCQKNVDLSKGELASKAGGQNQVSDIKTSFSSVRRQSALRFK